eukprot:723898-Prorocentrum_minimum.AAC.1
MSAPTGPTMYKNETADMQGTEHVTVSFPDADLKAKNASFAEPMPKGPNFAKHFAVGAFLFIATIILCAITLGVVVQIESKLDDLDEHTHAATPSTPTTRNIEIA